MFDKMKTLLEINKKAGQIRKRLEETVFEITGPEGYIKIMMSGSQEVKDVSILKKPQEVEKASLEREIKETYNKAVKHSQAVAASAMKEITGFNLPGMT